MEFSPSAIYKNYSEFREQSIAGLQVKHEEIQSLLHLATGANGIEVQKIGESFMGLPIHKVVIGSGSIKVLGWCQMHGNESTATKAFFDLLNLMRKEEEVLGSIARAITLIVIPMLNPDGANAFTRINAQGIDINRDAVACQSPESKILIDLFEEVKPQFCLNLHDQKAWYNVGQTSIPATLSFLAPAYNFENSVNASRARAMKLVAEISTAVKENFDVGVSRYSDSFEPRAFGDFFQSRGASTVLFEAGGYYEDNDREYVRGLYFYSLLCCLHSISLKGYESAELSEYSQIPISDERMFEWIIKGVQVEKNGRSWITDVGGRREFSGSKFGKGVIEAIGDLEGFHGYKIINGQGCKLLPGKTINFNEYKASNIGSLISDGYTTLVTESPVLTDPLPLNEIPANKPHAIFPGEPANFVLQKDGKAVTVVLNGFILDPAKMPFENYYGVSLNV